MLAGGHLIMGEEAVQMAPSKTANLLWRIWIENIAQGFRTIPAEEQSSPRIFVSDINMAWSLLNCYTRTLYTAHSESVYFFRKRETAS